jgi:DNA ligase-associated metallophosphoesterase
MSALETMDAMTIALDGHALVLTAHRAAFDPVLKSLFVADAHFGKDAVFRARGIPVPVGTTADNIGRLDALIEIHQPDSIVFLGDLLHARESHGDETMDALLAWRTRHHALRMVMVEGNHDRHAGALSSRFDIERVDEAWRLGPWALCHYPQEVPGAYALAGHEHPVYRVTTRVDSVRLPCFRFSARAGVLPAFGSFTGGLVINGSVSDQMVYLVAEGHILQVR